jgi:fatty-acyl-CoA synthase
LSSLSRLGGFLVSPREIEAHLEDLPSVAEAQVVGVSTKRGTKGVGFFIEEEGHELVEEEILERCKNDLAEFKVSRWIVALPNFPKTESTNGVNIRRDKLRRMVSELLETKEARG